MSGVHAPLHTLWAFQAQASTRERRRRRTPGVPADDSSDDEADASDADADALLPGVSNGPSVAVGHDAAVLATQAEDRRWLRATNVVARAGSTQTTAEQRTRQRIRHEARRAARAEHLPWRGKCAQEARILRVINGIPPMGSWADADQLSDWEEALETAKIERVRFGEKDIVQIGRRRTLIEEELSHEEAELQRGDAPEASFPSDTFSLGEPSREAWGALDSDSSYVARRASLPQRWVPRGAVEALDAARTQDLDLDADIDDLDD
ncbi:hypothetical protein MCUN1_003859 [Malassezia cuniculi]|uniref:Uncharacterized protein n=1 Tax=Malassezia cuniculi TaxID=948313 RepID=A0AAF0F226_9BASI|nr:hypothetical protein MCUN1_003859 [Malassezia cuniculi]